MIMEELIDGYEEEGEGYLGLDELFGQRYWLEMDGCLDG